MQRVLTPRVLSGIQPTGVPHLGNYLGALVNWVKLQPESSSTAAHTSTHGAKSGAGDVLYSIVDLHAITMPYDSNVLRQNCREMAASLLACGVDPQRSSLFLQSQVKEHAELAWLLGCITPLGWLKRMTQFKDKGKKQDKAGLGLLGYPVLMSADILVYQAARVPVGDDQSQHLELTRDIAGSFNSTFGPVFRIPEGIFPSGKETRIMSLRDGRKKMSKSDKSDMSRINLTDSADDIAAKLRKAKSDATIGISYDPETRPELANLLTIFSAVSGRSIPDLVGSFKDSSMQQFKQELTDAVVSHVTPIGSEVQRLLGDPHYIDSVLVDGQRVAQSIAADTMADVKKAMGFAPSL